MNVNRKSQMLSNVVVVITFSRKLLSPKNCCAEVEILNGIAA